MAPEMIAAVAACAAALISILNVGLTARLTRAQDRRRWTRELLPELVRDLTDALHVYYMKVFTADWSAVPKAERGTFGIDEYRQCSSLLDKLEVFAQPRTIESAREAIHRAGAIRMYMSARVRSEDDRTKWDLYWDYADASHRFLEAARLEMGLSRPPIPPGLARRRRNMRRTWVDAIRGSRIASALGRLNKRRT